MLGVSKTCLKKKVQTACKFLELHDTEVYICPSNDDTNIRGLLLEDVKLVICENVLISVYFMMFRD